MYGYSICVIAAKQAYQPAPGNYVNACHFPARFNTAALIVSTPVRIDGSMIG